MESRSLIFEGGTSSKFWAIRVDGSTHTVHYGRTGTAGQVKTKSFAGEDAAVAAAEKLVAEKLRKGYAEDGAPAVVPEPAESPVPAAAPSPPAADPGSPGGSGGSPAAGPAPVPIDDDRPPIDLTPAEWSIATWRPLPHPPVGEPAPFDPGALLSRLRLGTAEWGHWRWRRSPIRTPMSREEAAYWLRATQRLAYGTTIAQRHAEVVGLGDTLDEAKALRLAIDSGLPDGDAMAPLVTLIGAARVAEILVDGRTLSRDSGLDGGVRLHLLPLLSADERTRLTERAREQVREKTRRDPSYSYGSRAVLAGELGLHDEVEEICARWPDGYFAESGGYGDWSTIAYGLPTAEALEGVVDRTRLTFSGDHAVAGWLAHTGLRRLDVFVDGALRATSKDEAAAVVAPLAARVHAAEAAPAMVRLLRDSRAPEIARAWLDDHPRQAAAGLVPLLGGGGGLAEAAGDELRRMARGPRRAVLDVVAGLLTPADRARLQERVLDAVAPPAPPLERAPDWLTDAAARLGRARLPAWLDPTTLPPLVVDGGTLGPAHLDTALRILRATTPDAGDPAAAPLRAAADPVVAEECSWAVFDAWLVGGAPSKDKWAMLQLGVLGGDRVAGRLAPMVRQWPGQSQHARAVLGLGVLRAIGTDAALMHLNGIAQKLKFKGLKTKAQEAMEAIAADKGMTRGELEDRIVPDCGLDERGARSFDYGPRSFAFVLGPGMKPMVRDGAGKVRAAPPKPGAKDDPRLAPAALAEWKLVKKTVADVAKIQGARLEQAMVGGRRWSGDDFAALLAGHPLQRHLVRLLVMGVYADGRVTATFRLTEEGDLSDADDAPFVLPPDATVGIVHPLDVEPPVAAAWGELLADYEVVPPFAQLGRPVREVLPAELDLDDLDRFAPHRIPPGPMVRILEAAEWERGAPQDGGVYALHAKHFPGADQTAVVEYEDGLWAGYVTEAGPQRLTHVYVLPGRVPAADLGWGLDRHGQYQDTTFRPLRWRDVDPIVRSEVLGDLEQLVAKAEA